MTLRFRTRETELAIARLEPDAAIPAWAWGGAFASVTRTFRELSIVCLAERVPGEVRHERGWAMLELEGPFAFELTGILASFLAPLAEAKIGIFAISTFDTDVVLVKRASLDAALAALARAGHVRVD
ncbi:MAG: ACT domain-containing protein [Acidobacteria bacterium]|nr:ACT domain-containing protein [Acidobacteriota bacterium]